MPAEARYLIRSLTPSDQDFLWEMLYQAIYVPAGVPPPDRAILQLPEVAKYGAGWGRPDDLGFVAAEITSRSPVGAAWLRRFSAEGPGYGFVDEATPELSLAVLPEHRGQGLGTLLLGRLLEAASLRYPAVSLSVDTRNPALRLYRRFGFEQVAVRGASLTMKESFSLASPEP